MPDRDPNEPVYLISIAAQLTGLHPQTVRLYERLGLVLPSRVNKKNRLYSDQDIERLLQIRRFTQEMGVNLAGVEIILDLLQKMEQIQQEVEALRAEVNASSGKPLGKERRPITA